MHCNGKCHMMKLMKQDEKKNEDNPERKSENKFEVICTFYNSPTVTLYTSATAIIYPLLKETVATGFKSTFFHPPQSLSL